MNPHFNYFEQAKVEFFSNNINFAKIKLAKHFKMNEGREMTDEEEALYGAILAADAIEDFEERRTLP